MSSQAAPDQLELVRGFVNTRELDPDVETFDSPHAAASWLADRGLVAPGTKLDRRDLERAVEFREGLRSLLEANNGDPLDDAAVAVVNDALANAALAVRFDRDGEPELAVEASGVDAAIARLAAIVYEAKVGGTWRRLKVCAADDCRWAFYDRSRNRSGTWCSMGVCGNRAKVRAYRERRAGEGG
jgi:predicted RNA-binding Zn ribbon-like protein